MGFVSRLLRRYSSHISNRQILRAKSALTHSKQSAEASPNRQTFRGLADRLSVFLLPFFAFTAFAAPPVSAQTSSVHAPKPRPKPTKTAPAQPKLVIAPDLAERFAKFKPIHIAFDSSSLTDKEQKMVAKLVDAAGMLESNAM